MGRRLPRFLHARPGGDLTMNALRLALLAIVSISLSGSDAWAAKLQVGTCTTQKTLLFTTVQAAINAAGATGGDTVAVCPGTYPEQITISKPLTLSGLNANNSSAPVITTPPGGLVAALGFGSLAAHVAVINRTTVNISNLGVDSAGNNVPCGNSSGNIFVMGIVYGSASSGTVKNVATRNQYSGTPPNTCGFGIGIGILDGSSVTVQNSMIESIDYGGIYASGTGTIARILNNMIMGPGVGHGSTNLISFYDGSTGYMTGNRLIDLNSSPVNNSPIGSCGIAVQRPAGSVEISNNTIGNTQCGIALYAANNTSITGNQIFGSSVSDGIYLCGNTNIVTGNTIASSAVAGVEIDPSCFGLTANNNTVQNNVINHTCAGILVDPSTTGHTLDGNSIFNATYNQLVGLSCP